MGRLVVTGDVVIDHHIYQGDRTKPGQEKRGVAALTVSGGAVQLYRLIDQLHPPSQHWKAELGVADPLAPPYGVVPTAASPLVQHAFATWSPFPLAGRHDKEQVWRAAQLLGYGEADPTATAHLMPLDVAPSPDLLVIDDAGSSFRLIGQKMCWHLPSVAERSWIVLKLSDPIARGDLWSQLQQEKLQQEKFVCVVSAADLRRESVSFRPGVSWDRTIEEVRGALEHHRLKHLMQCRHLVVTFSFNGALLITRGKPTATLVFAPTEFEGDGLDPKRGKVIGSMSAMTAAIARHVAAHIDGKELKLANAMKAGLAAMRDLHREGHGRVMLDSKARGVAKFVAPAGYPLARLAKVIVEDQGKATADIEIDWEIPRIGSSLIAASQHPQRLQPPLPTIGLARAVALYGPRALSHLPHMVIDKTIVVDRLEIEALRGLQRSMGEYHAEVVPTGDIAKPFSIGVFGPPGAGKSRGVKQLALDIFGAGSWLEFNLSQFKDAKDLRGAFHQVRDVVLAGRTPVVFWDEFDSSGYEWLRHLLAPMQDGRFQDGELNHAIGKSIFIFAGGTSERYADFGPIEWDETARSDWRMKKGPDFVSRLDAFYDVAGANQRRKRIVKPGRGRRIRYVADTQDDTYPLRRALMVRHHLRCDRDETPDFDSDLLDALLRVPRYHHGSRSLEKLVRPLRPEKGVPVRRSALPSKDRIAMHVDAEAFHCILGRLDSYRREDVKLRKIAEAIYNSWCVGKIAEEKAKGLDFNPDKFSELDRVEQEVNIAGAMRLPEVLAMAGMTIVERPELGKADFDALVALRLETMAEAEHDGWVRQRLAHGWQSGQQRTPELRTHDTLIPYAELDERFKEKDRANVRAAWDRLAAEGFEVGWLLAEEAEPRVAPTRLRLRGIVRKANPARRGPE